MTEQEMRRKVFAVLPDVMDAIAAGGSDVKRVEDHTATDEQQMAVLLEAFFKFKERNEEYQDLWRQGGVEDSLHHVQHKSARLSSLKDWLKVGDFKGEKRPVPMARLDDATDLINYSAFFIRNVRDPLHRP